MRWKLLLLIPATLCVLASCSKTAPTEPSVPDTDIVVTAPQVLRLTVMCPHPKQGMVVGFVYTRVNVTYRSNEWVATAYSAADGAFQIRFHLSGPGVVPGSMLVAGTISGTAEHLPELSPGLTWNTRVTFAEPASLTGGASPAGSSYYATDEIGGVGEGSLVLTSSMGDTCAGISTFFWTIFPLASAR